VVRFAVRPATGPHPPVNEIDRWGLFEQAHKVADGSLCRGYS
jgi:hypothetical protein